MAEKERLVRWYEWSISTEKEKLLRIIDALDSALPEGWQKELTSPPLLPPFMDESNPSRTVAASYSLPYTQERGGVTLRIDLWRDQRLLGGHISGTSPPTISVPSWMQFMRVEADGFLDRGIIPAAERLGVNVHRATFSDIFSDELPWEVRESLTKFHEMSRKALPLNRTESEAWQAFVVAAYRGPDTIGYEPLADWLAAQGWSPSAAAELTAQFFEQCRLLTRYHDALVVA